MTRSVTPVAAPLTGPANTVPGHGGEWIRTIAALALLTVVIPLVVVDWGRNAASVGNVLLAMIVVLISGVRLAQIFGTGRPDLMRAFFYLFVYIFLGVAALAQTVAGEFPQDNRSYLDGTVTTGLIIVLTGIVGYEVGWALWKRRSRSAAAPPDDTAPAADDPVPDADGPRPRWYFSRWRVAALGVFALGATGYQVASKGFESFFLSRSQTTGALTGAEYGNLFYTETNKTAGLLSAFITQVPLFIALFLVLYCRHHGLWPKSRNLITDTIWRLFVVALVAANLIINNPIGNARFWFSLIVVALVSVYLQYTRAASVRTYVAFALGILLLVFNALDAFRNTKVSVHLSGPGTSLVTDQTYGMFQMVLNGVEYVDSRGHTGGAQVLGSLLNFVPRSLWESKPIPTGQVVDPQYARSATLWTEMHVDFGLLGVLVMFVLFGAVSVALTRRAVAARPGVLHAVVPVFAVFQILLLRGSVMPAVGHLYQLVAVLALVIGVHRLARRPGRSRADAVPGVPDDRPGRPEPVGAGTRPPVGVGTRVGTVTRVGTDGADGPRGAPPARA